MTCRQVKVAAFPSRKRRKEKGKEDKGMEGKVITSHTRAMGRFIYCTLLFKLYQVLDAEYFYVLQV